MAGTHHELRGTANGSARLHFLLAGAGDPPVLFLHGFGSDHFECWVSSGWTALLVGAGRTVIVPDLRGHGRSPRSTTAVDYTAEALLDDLLSVVDAVTTGPVDVVGHSIGARLGTVFAHRFPNRVRRLVVGGVGIFDQFVPSPPSSLFGMLRSTDTAAEELESLLTSIRKRPTDEIRALAACVDGLASIPLPETLATPTLVFAGSQDHLATGAEQLAASWDASFVAVAGRNHTDTLTSPELKTAVCDFLNA